MRWLFFLLSVLCFAVAFKTHSLGLAALCLVLALLFLLSGVLALVSHRIQAGARDEAHIASPEELRRLREQAQARAAPAAAPRSDAPPPTA